jgi:hypothetical protein
MRMVKIVFIYSQEGDIICLGLIENGLRRPNGALRQMMPTYAHMGFDG